MRKFHVHINVASLADSIAFYNQLFDQQPSKLQSDYAKWELTDPPLNFAISTGAGDNAGINHLGLQMNARQLEHSQQRLATLASKVEKDAACCYALSDKFWLNDPNGILWENFYTKADDAGVQQACCDDSCGCHSQARG